MPGQILTISYIIVAGALADLWFNALPRQMTQADLTKFPDGFSVAPFLTSALFLDLLAIIGFGAVVIAIFLRGASKNETIPVHDPRILESINYHE